MTIEFESLPADISEAVSAYRRTSVGLLRGLIGAGEIAALCAETDRLWLEFQSSGPSNLRLGIRKDLSGGIVLDRLDPVADVSPVFAALNRHPTLRRIAEACLGEPVTIMKEKLIYKRPGTGGFGAHRDQTYTTVKSGVPGSEVLTIGLALDPAPSASGPIEFFPSLRLKPLPAPPGEPRDVDEAALEGVESLLAELQPGDAVLFDGQIPHRSAPNQSGHSRRTYMISYVPARYPQARDNYYAERLVEQASERKAIQANAIYFR